jgi:hypothetical protein
MLCLVDGVLHRLEPNSTVFGEGIRQVGAIANRVNVGIIRLAEPVDADAVVDGEARCLGEFRVGQNANANQDQIGCHHSA